MNARKRELFERNKSALDVNKSIETYVSDIMSHLVDSPLKNDIEVMVQMLFEKNQDVIFDIYTVECLIERALKPQVLDWCNGLVECIEKKTVFLNNSCEVVRALIETATTTEEGGDPIDRA